MLGIRSIRGPLGRFGTNRDGASAMEMALALPVFLVVLVGIIELTVVLTVTVLAEGGLREAARFGITGRTPDGLTREQKIVEIVREHTLGMIDVSPNDIVMKTYPSFASIGAAEPFTDANGNGSYDEGEPFTDTNGNGQWDNDQGTTGVGGSEDIVYYEMDYRWQFLTPFFRLAFPSNHNFEMQATLAVRNEPYAATGASE